MFKADWEKTSVTYQLSEDTLEKMVRLAYPDKKLISHKLISGGCANLNIKILLEDDNYPLILRIYLRDKDAAYREQKLGKLLKQTVPVPLTHYIDELEGQHFAITEFMPGIPLRDLLLNNAPHNLGAIMHEVGTILSTITAHEFSQAGFFDKDLNVVPHTPSDDYLMFAKDCLMHKTVLSVLTPETISKIRKNLEQYGYLLPDDNEKHLVHADFDPANLLVNQVDGLWKVSGVLDWEFSFSGSVLCDVANMLRYAHKMLPEFQDAFLNGLVSNGITLPKNWRTTVNLLNLLSLLDCLKRSDLKISPNQCADIRELINHILSELNLMQQTERIEIAPYDPNWPNIFEAEAAAIKKALGDNCIAIHHVGSTSVSGLVAKPKIDIIAVVKEGIKSIPSLEKAGFAYRGEWSIPFKYGFTKRDSVKINLHVFEEKHPEIEVNILFRDYLRKYPDARDEYAILKYNLISEESSHEKNNSIYKGYTLGKHNFIQSILNQAGFNKYRFVLCTHYSEWNTVKHFRNKYFFGPHNIDDPYTWTFDHRQHKHFVLYQGTEIIGYAHIQLWPNERAAIRIIVIDEAKRNNNFGGKLLHLCEKWLKSQGYKSIHTESRPTALAFYKKNGYIDMPFNDPDGHEGGPEDIAVGKLL